ncbi:hypothetical protein WJX82_005540 [Trebouxia sp. C0006]
MGKQLAAAITKYNNEDPSASIQVIHKDVPTKLKEGMGDSIKAAAGSSRTRRAWHGQQVVVPSNVDDDMAAQFLINPVTAYGFLEVMQVPKGEYLLQQAANSVLGKELISMAQKQGTKTINLVRQHEVVHELKQLGAEEVIVTTDEDVTARVMQITDGKGAWASINPIGGKASRHLPPCTRQGGKVHVFSLFKEEVVVPMFALQADPDSRLLADTVAGEPAQ